MHVLRAVSHVPDRNVLLIDSFLRNGYLQVKPKGARKKRELNEDLPLKDKSFQDEPKFYVNEWNEPPAEKLGDYLEIVRFQRNREYHVITAQMDNGDKEDLDQTDNFGNDLCSLNTFRTDYHMSFKD